MKICHVITGPPKRPVLFCSLASVCVYRLSSVIPVHTSNNVEATFDFVAKKRQQCRTSFALKFRPFDKVERCFDNVAQNGNIVEATGNKVACCFDNVASTLLLVWTGFYADGGRADWPPSVWAVEWPTLHGGPVLLLPVRATPCLN